ncbi:MAG: efflux RND transporter periplasmic adaptor subunit [Candidatus Saccharicenans sp.]|nr:MAG: hypothetical protein C0168_07290 [Candidatus Aminicenantes bacterium]HEK86822.1 efflux RND transporter periplasmic adaptor subunit [Candidatus Aminicenantes bacterium]
MKKKLILLSLVILVALGGFSCKSSPKSNVGPISQKNQSLSSATEDTGAARGLRLRQRNGAKWINEEVSLSEKEKEVIKVETARVSYLNIQAFLTAAGKIIPPNSRMCLISYAFPARVSRIEVKLGDWVNEGSPLITLQSEEVGKSRAEFFKARADLELAQANYERQKRLVERGAGAQKDYLAAETELKVAQASLEACEKKLHLMGFSEEEVKKMAETHQINPVITLFSPIKGKVVELKVVPGEMVDQTKDMMTVLDPRVLWVEADIFEKDIAKVRPGQKVEITVPAYPEKSFYGRISYVGDILKNDTRTITVRTEVENPELLLKPGMFATLRIYLNGDRPVLAVPESAVCDQLGEKFVFVPQANGYQVRKVELGAKQDGFCEVLNGLKEGEEVVTSGSFQLKSKLFEEALKSSIRD